MYNIQEKMGEFMTEKERMVDASKERLSRGSEPMKQEPLTIQIGRRIVLRQARRMRDPVRRRTGRGSRPTRFDKYPLVIFWSRSRIARSFENFSNTCHVPS